MKKSILITFEESKLKQIDRARKLDGDVGRSAWIRQAVDEKLRVSEADLEPQNI